MSKCISILCLIPLFFLGLFSCKGQQVKKESALQLSNQGTKKVGGACETCEIMYVDQPDSITHIDTSMGWQERGQKLLVTGTVFQPDGVTPARDVILYYWQTNSKGLYADAKGLNPKARKHGYIRGWVKTNQEGKYAIYTVRPAPYPNDVSPAHIHFLVKEPEFANEYYIDDLVFDDDPLLIPYKKKNPLENRGGSGIVRILVKGDMQVAEHDIRLGLNIPDYPVKEKDTVSSGLPVGYDQPSFIPYHAYGPDKGSRACPVCKYGRYHGIVFFVGNKPNWTEIKQWLIFLEKESKYRKQYLKAYFVYGNANGYDSQIRRKELEKLGEELKIRQMALCFVPSFSDEETEANLNQLNPLVENTFVIYKHRRIVNKQINLKPSPLNFQLISTILDSTRGDFFNLQSLPHD